MQSRAFKRPGMMQVLREVGGSDGTRLRRASSNLACQRLAATARLRGEEVGGSDGTRTRNTQIDSLVL